MKDNSQGDLPKILEYFSQNKPKYNSVIDVGARGLNGNSSNLILDYGWSGLLIEPTPSSYEYLQTIYKGNANVTLEQVAIGLKEDTVSFYIHPKSADLNSLEKGYHYRELKEGEVKEIKVRLRKLENLLQERNIPFDFDLLSIDSEGFDFVILDNFLSCSQYRPRYIIHEIQHPGMNGFIDMLKQYGYSYICKTNGNMHYAYKGV